MNDTKQAERFSDDTQEDRPQVLQPSALSTAIRAEIDAGVATAKMYPRSISTFLRRAESMACVSVDVAAACEYTLPRKKQNGDKVTGPSVRLAEIVASQYGNLRVGARIVEINANEIVAQGVAIDLETNVSFSSDVRRRITNKEGRRYSDDMIIMTCNAACAIASRNATFKVVPLAIVAPIAEKARAVALGTAETLNARRDKLLAWFQGKGIDKARVLAALEVKGEADIDLDKFQDLNGIWNAIREGETSLEEAFPIVRESRFSDDKKTEEKKA